jgi:hypothetical protein
VATVLTEDHHFWIDTKITLHARRVSLAVGKRLAESGVLEQPGDAFDLTLAEVLALADRERRLAYASLTSRCSTCSDGSKAHCAAARK